MPYKDPIKDAECKKRWAKENIIKVRESSLKAQKKYRARYPERVNETMRNYRKRNPIRVKARQRIYDLMRIHPEWYPLDSQCIFCPRIENLEHGHLDYEDDGHNYVTACHQCNCWMDKN